MDVFTGQMFPGRKKGCFPLLQDSDKTALFGNYAPNLAQDTS
jgi:hypothetical protein